MVHIDTYSLIYGVCIGTVTATLTLIGVIIRDIVQTRKQTQREVREAYDNGITRGRELRGIEKARIEIQIDRLKETLEEIERVQDKA